LSRISHTLFGEKGRHKTASKKVAGRKDKKDSSVGDYNMPGACPKRRKVETVQPAFFVETSRIGEISWVQRVRLGRRNENEKRVERGGGREGWEIGCAIA